MGNAAIFMLLMFVANPDGGQDAFVMDYNLTKSDCDQRMLDYDIHANSNIEFACEESQK